MQEEVYTFEDYKTLIMRDLIINIDHEILGGKPVFYGTREYSLKIHRFTSVHLNRKAINFLWDIPTETSGIQNQRLFIL